MTLTTSRPPTQSPPRTTGENRTTPCLQDELVPLPAPFSSIPRHPLLLFPSPIHPLPRITADLALVRARGGGDGDGDADNVSIYAKREDLNSPYAFGGNKTRKLEYLLADALSRHCDTLVSVGGIQSNHTRQVAAVAARTGLRAVLVQENWVDWEGEGKQQEEKEEEEEEEEEDADGKDGKGQGTYDLVGNILLSRVMGADVRVPPHDSEGMEKEKAKEKEKEKAKEKGNTVTFGIEHKDIVKEVVRQCEETGKKPYYIPAGASDHPLGELGFARWAFEVEQQEKAMGLFFDTVVVCAVTGSTLAGMIAGFKLAEQMDTKHQDPKKTPSKKRKVIGIDASATVETTRAQILRIAKQTAARIGLTEEDISDADVILDDRYHAGTNGIPDKRTWEAIEYAARMEAFITDPVYEGKSFAGMIDMIRNGEIRGGNVLYAHLGGQLALNAYHQLGKTKE
ncbi:1-aminocyclopropane-1-carboxylate deaminase [Penicillium ucsense]|uniref:1-aminocyclopropane-1-carboxylate deaminase n=1 Tax=Penicillium ucsense TaxID=2839758 RepID=A0A8J8W3N1_9EURO|nr:1-aminocyclopropane-1-carboxylate deaminase [Penicillium ucsense]